MEIKQQSKLSFYGVDIIETTFNVKRRFNFEEQINLEVDAKLIKSIGDGNFKILMSVSLNVENRFNLLVRGIGNFELESELPNKEQKHFVNANAPAILFPYIRSFLSTFSSSCGQSLPMIVIPPQFFKGELEEITFENQENIETEVVSQELQPKLDK